jgi:hypothetical protein
MRQGRLQQPGGIDAAFQRQPRPVEARRRHSARQRRAQARSRRSLQREGGADIRAQGGSEEALGGTLVVLDPTLYQTDPLDPVFGAISASMIETAGFSTLQALGSITSVGDVDLHLDRAFFLTSRPFGGLNGQDLNDPATRNSFAPVIRSGGEMAIWAPYVRFDSGIQTVSTPLSGTPGTFGAAFHADVIDVSGAVLFDRSIGEVLLDRKSVV